MREPNSVLVAIAEAAKSLGGISHWTLRKHVAAGRLRVVRIGRRVFLDTEEIERIRREGLPSLGSSSQTPLKPQENSRSGSQRLEKEQCIQTER